MSWMGTCIHRPAGSYDWYETDLDLAGFKSFFCLFAMFIYYASANLGGNIVKNGPKIHALFVNKQRMGCY